MDLFSPEAILMLFLAGLLDLIGVICLILDLVFGIGEILSYIPDGIGILFFGFWTFMRSLTKGKTMEEAKEETSEKIADIRETGEKRREAIRKRREALRKKREMAKKGKKLMMKKGGKTGIRFGLATLGEIIPFLGAAPFWSIFVFLELKND
ncbi:hypothetical protein KAT95_03035 [Candidatus Parcubacteria bacterium]|nr:hypothetical protein [Candidatus Parcubacteria bacterium]